MDGNTNVVFKLLDYDASFNGNVENPIVQNDLNEAFILLENKIKNGQFIINFDNRVRIYISKHI